MSFITKRERVFNEYDIYDLPARNEGKLKAYASCTDARAWSHFGSDKTEHLVEIIKRNNETCRPKYVPTDAIVNTLMAAKNAEIGRLKHKIEEFEQMLAAYDQLELTCDQKCEIANAHAAIKAANKELDDMCLDLDLSGFTEGMDSEAFQTGKSRGDEASLHTAHEIQKTKPTESSLGNSSFSWEFEKEPVMDKPVKETKANQTTLAQARDASTSAHDPRIDDLQDVIITKDAKLSAMQNTIAVMENDICEPYCIYAHIYTALEKIFATLCQNMKYKEYLDLLTAGKDTRELDVKGKILFKLKVLEKFSLALIAPCTQESKPNNSQHECSCYRAQVETAFALTSPPTRNLNMDSKRALLVADIMENQEIKEILSKESISTKIDDDQIDESFGVDSYSIETENLNRLKNLQKNFDDLLNCYENLKYEKNCLFIKCREYDELEKQFEQLRGHLQEYNLLWNEKEHYKKRSEDLDILKEKFLVLSEETSNIESKLEAETKINFMKCKAIEELRKENIALEKKLNDMSTSCEREKNSLTCKLKEYECKMMCQEQQIKSLSAQIDEMLDQNKIPSNIDATKTLELTDQIDSLKQQIKNLQNAIICDEEEKQQLEEEYRNKLDLINDLKMEIEDWKSNYDRAVRSYNYEIQILKEENRKLLKEIDEKSHENNRLIDELEHKKCLCIQLERITDNYDNNMSILENERKNALFSLQLARTDSQKLIGNYKASNSQEFQQDKANIKNDIIDENERCLMNIVDHDNEDSILLQEIQKLRADNITNLSKLKDENVQNKRSLELLKKESAVLKHKLRHLENLSQQFQNLKESNESLLADKVRLETELQIKTSELDSAKNLTRRESETLISHLQKSEYQKDQITNKYQDIVREKISLLSDLSNKDEQLQVLSKSLNELKIENDRLRQESQRVGNLERELRQLNNAYENLQHEFQEKTKDLSNLYNNLQNKIEENHNLQNQIKNLQHHDVSNKNSLTTLQIEKTTIQSDLNLLKKESSELSQKLKYYEGIENDFNQLKLAYDQIKSKNNKMEEDIEIQTQTNKTLQEKNKELHCHNQNLLSQIVEIEKGQIIAKNEIMKAQEIMQEFSSLTKEVENMKLEKKLNHQKIKNLLNDLDESEQKIFKLNEDVLARDDKIAVLENHINLLQDEVKRLHSTLSDLTECSEEIKEYSIQNINDSIKRMEAHHSKATHDMRLDLAKLQTENNILENQLSKSTLKSEESIRDIMRLQNERKIIANDIKQLEIKSTGNSVLLPSDCTIENILASISKISQSIDTRHHKNTSLEKTLLKVQSSFQLAVEKADEEKKLVDLEKLKLINEKEAAIADLQNMELNLKELKQIYEKQISQDRCIINDLEAEILNQNLIIDKINKNKENYISKLEKEIQSLQNMYEASTIKVGELQNTLHNISEDNKKYIEKIKEINISLKDKCIEIEELNNILQNIRNTSVQSIWTQVDINNKEFSHKLTQTIEDHRASDKTTFIPVALEKMQQIESNSNKNHPKFTIKSTELMAEILPKTEPYSINEVQILRANIDVPSSNSNKGSNIENKMKKLNFGPMEKCSIPNLDNSQDLSNEHSLVNQENAESESNNSLLNRNPQEQSTKNSNIVDIYNVQSNPMSQSPTNKLLSINDKKIKKSNTDARLSSTSLCDIKNKNVGSSIKKDLKRHKSDKDLFLIYKDNSSDNTSPLNFENELLEIYHKAQPKHKEVTDRSIITTPHIKDIKKSHDRNESVSLRTKQDDDSIRKSENKPKLKIKIPRIVIDSSSVITTSDADSKSLNSYCSLNRSAISDTNINNQKHLSTVPLYGSPNTLDKPSREEKVHDTLFRKSNDHSESESNNKLRNNVHANLLRIGGSQTSPPDSLNTISNKTELPKGDSNHRLLRVGANVLLIEYSDHTSTIDSISAEHTNGSQEILKTENFGLQYILDSIKCENDPEDTTGAYKQSKHIQKISKVRKHDMIIKNRSRFETHDKFSESNTISDTIKASENLKSPQKSFIERGVLVKMDSIEDYENKIHHLTTTLENIEKDYKKKIEAVKIQYDNNIKNIINEHNQGVKSIQCLHEETLQDVIKIHENEAENLRSMSIEALRRVEKLEKENYSLKTKIIENSSPAFYDDEPVKIPPEVRKRRGRSRIDTKTLTKTNVEAFNVKPKTKSHGPCTCSVDMNISDTIKNIFEQVDADQRKVAENTYLKYIANKISNSNIEALDAQELSFLHIKVCRTWKTKLSKEEALQKRINSLESELINKQRQAQQHMAELDRKVAEERRRLQEVREAVCRSSPEESRDCSPEPSHPLPLNADKNMCSCNSVACTPNVGARRSAGDLGPALPSVSKSKRTKIDTNKTVLPKMDAEERRDKKFYDDPPIRLKRSHDRPTLRKK